MLKITNWAICESRNGELGNGIRGMWKIRVGMWGMRSECGESEWKCKKCENQGGNLDIATEIA